MDAKQVEVGVIWSKYRAKSCIERLVTSMYGHVVLPCILMWSGIAFQAKYMK